MSGSVLDFDAYIIDLDGVLTDTAILHARSWKCLFDGFFATFEEANGVRPFRMSEDYARYIRGRSHAEGLRGFLASRGIELADGHQDDPPDAPTIHALAQRKSQIFARLVEERGVSVFAGSRCFLDHLRTLARPTALVTASRNGELVLERAGLSERFDVVVDGRLAERERLVGQPAPDCFLFAAAWLGIDPAWTVVIEATEAGVKAGRRGGFGCVIGVLRGSSQAALRAAGADLVVEDLAALL
jgi:HAD superfamily hydrolase (TIGR01509 family)